MPRPDRSRLAPAETPTLPPIDGVRLAAVASDPRLRNRPDLAVVELARGTSIAGALTRSQAPSAAVDWCRRNLPGGSARLIVANAGNANAFTGRRGEESVGAVARAAAGLFDCDEGEIFQASTGAIGEPLDHDRLIAALPVAQRSLAPDDWLAVASALMTTDSFPKLATRVATIEGRRVTLNGVCKGSGMIAPDLGTMLSFLFTDAAVPAGVLSQLLMRGVDRSFNCITVDSDTSTSDTCLLAATGRAGNEPAFSAGDRRLGPFREALDDLLIDLARQVVADGQDANRFVTITVTGAAHARAARKIGLAVANSPLVRKALRVADPRWEWIVVAVGKAGEKANRDRLTIRVGDARVAVDGVRAADFDAAEVAGHMAGTDVQIAIDVGIGVGAATVWTCDGETSFSRPPALG
jgi:glutamate N-acetyltransferase/amino-acid N-acetyltransferase